MSQSSRLMEFEQQIYGSSFIARALRTRRAAQRIEKSVCIRRIYSLLCAEKPNFCLGFQFCGLSCARCWVCRVSRPKWFRGASAASHRRPGRRRGLRPPFLPAKRKFVKREEKKLNSVRANDHHHHSAVRRVSWWMDKQTDETLPTLTKNEFIHFVKVFFWMCKRSSCSVLMRSFSNLAMPSRCVMLDRCCCVWILE